MFNQLQFKSYADYLVFRASRKAWIIGEWKGRQRGKQLGRKAGRQEGHQEGRQQGRQEGRQEGRQAGRQEGRQEVHRDFIRLLFERSGCQLSSTANQRLEQADLVTLKGWVENLLANEVPSELKD